MPLRPPSRALSSGGSVHPATGCLGVLGGWLGHESSCLESPLSVAFSRDAHRLDLRECGCRIHFLLQACELQKSFQHSVVSSQKGMSHSEKYFLFQGETLEILFERYLLQSEKGLLIVKLDSLEGIRYFLLGTRCSWHQSRR